MRGHAGFSPENQRNIEHLMEERSYGMEREEGDEG